VVLRPAMTGRDSHNVPHGPLRVGRSFAVRLGVTFVMSVQVWRDVAIAVFRARRRADGCPGHL
jgi:hypothetical protein